MPVKKKSRKDSTEKVVVNSKTYGTHERASSVFQYHIFV